MRSMPENTFITRQRKLAAALEAHGFHIFALNAGPSLHYLTGLDFHLSERPIVFFFAPDAAPVAVLPELEKGKLSDLAFDLRPYTYGEDPRTWARTFKHASIEARLDFKGVGIEPRRMRVLELRLLENAAPRSAYIGNEEVMAGLRMIKGDEEVDAVRRAVHVAERALEQTLGSVKEGMTEREAASELVLQLFQSGSGSVLPFSPIVAFGERTSNPHAVPGDQRLAAGDLMLFDWGASVDGYASDLTRMFSFGDPDEELAKISAVVEAANAAAFEAASPGVAAGDVDRAARDLIAGAGYEHAFVHRTGHGLGMEVHEEPYIRAGNDMPLGRGMIFTIEPGIYIPGAGGARIEDDVLITSDGAESLSTLPRDLRMLDA